MYKDIPSEVKKMKQGMSYSRKEKTIIMNVFKYFRSQHLDKTITEIVRQTAKATGCSEKSIFSFRKEEVSPQGFKEPSKKKIRKNININNRLVKYDETVRKAIKNIIYDLKSKNVVPSLSVISENIKCNNLPRFSIMTLRRLLYDMGFYYEKNGNKSILVEKGITSENCTDANKSVANKKPLEPTSSTSTENLESVSNPVSNKTNSQLTSHLPEHVTKGISVKKVDELQSYPSLNVHQTYRIQALGSFQENHFTLEPPSHMPMMLPPRMPPYHLHSSMPHSYPSNMDQHLKRQVCLPHHDPQLAPHNIAML